MLGRFTSRRAALPEPVAAPEPPMALPPEAAPALAVAEPPAEVVAPVNTLLSDKLLDAKVRLHRRLIEEINLSVLEKMQDEEVRRHVHGLVSQYTLAERLALNSQELEDFVAEILDEMTGLGPIEPLLKDHMVNDILINGHEQVYVERAGVLEPTLVRFKDEAHLLRIVNKIVSAVGRRVDESQPLCDARLLDGSRINIAVRPIAVDGPLVSIRKFSKKPYNLRKLVDIGAIRTQMAELLAAAVKARVTLIISGGTGSGKTTMLNALSAFISEKERLVTIEDAAELQLQQPHGGPAAQHRGQGGNPPARAGEERAAHAARPHHPRRVPRRGSVRHASGHEHRPRRLHGDGPRQHPARRALASRADDRHGRHADDGLQHPRPDRRRHPLHRAAAAPLRRQARGHQHRRDHRARER